MPAEPVISGMLEIEVGDSIMALAAAAEFVPSTPHPTVGVTPYPTPLLPTLLLPWSEWTEFVAESGVYTPIEGPMESPTPLVDIAGCC